MPTRRLRIDLKRVRANAATAPGRRRPLREELLRDLAARGFRYEGGGWWRGDPALLRPDEVLEVDGSPPPPEDPAAH